MNSKQQLGEKPPFKELESDFTDIAMQHLPNNLFKSLTVVHILL